VQKLCNKRAIIALVNHGQIGGENSPPILAEFASMTRTLKQSWSFSCLSHVFPNSLNHGSGPIGSCDLSVTWPVTWSNSGSFINFISAHAIFLLGDVAIARRPTISREFSDSGVGTD